MDIETFESLLNNAIKLEEDKKTSLNRVEIDRTIIDAIFTRLDNDLIIRPNITFVIDKASRGILGHQCNF
jgi:hypothetical protein